MYKKKKAGTGCAAANCYETNFKFLDLKYKEIVSMRNWPSGHGNSKVVDNVVLEK